MRKISRQVLAMLCVAALLLGGILPGAGIMTASAAGEHTLWLVGDSTVCDYTGQDLTYYWPRNGYGMQIGQYLDGTYAVQNLALSGTSSKSFLLKENYQTLIDGIKAGDALIIGFGHNDEKAEEDRYTNPNGDWQTEGSFAKSLYDNYVKPAQDKGAEVILCTPIVRRTTSGAWSNDKLHITADSGDFKGGDYPAAIRKLGQDKNVAVVDLTALTKAKYDELGVSGTLALHAQQGKDVPDNTHLNVYGAEVVAQLLAEAISKDSSLALSAHVDAARFTPDQSHITIGPEYKEPVPGTYPTTASVLGEPYNVYNVAGDVEVTFKPTAFGALGGTPSKKNDENWLFETDADGNMHMAAGNNKGKVNSVQDGIMMYWYAVPADKQFSLTATAKLNSFDTGSQVAFGLMARDDMRIDARDCYTDGSYPNYVAAGTLGDSSTNCFYRKDGALTTTTKLSTPLEAGTEYVLNITSNSDGYACKFGDEPAQSQGFDFSLLGVDKDYVYVGMFTARKVDVTFSNISLVITDGAGSDTPDEPAGDVTITAGGWLETAYAELQGAKAADVTAVSYIGAMTGALSADDLAYLVRDVDGVTRIDIPGLKAGTYDLTVTVGGKDYTATGVKVLAHDRSGFAHYNYTEGVGAYNDDGTLKENATVLYVTEENKNTVSLTVGDITVTGIGNILNCKGYDQNNGKPKILLKMTDAGRPLVVRIIGDVTAPEGVSVFNSTENGGAVGDNGGMCTMQYASNITIEGIGVGATVDGWGFCFDAGGTGMDASKRGGENFEVRNVAFRNVPEDCIGIQGEVKNGELDSPAEHIWVHNCEFYGPSGLPDASSEGDKSEGDGAVDFKNGQYMTLSYNYFEGYHKTSLIGGGDSNPQYHVTWHHNYWKNVQTRSPLARQADVHLYNNLYEGQTGYCMSLRANTYIFSEYNTFIDCKDVAIDEGTGGVCKSYMDEIVNCTGRDASVKVTDKAQTVESANKFANFDTDPESYVAKGAYLLDTSVEAAQANIKAYGGTMKALPADEPAGELAGTVIILHSNDVHGAVEGYAKMDALKKEYEAKGADVLVVDAGDFSQGETSVSISQGATAIELMNMVGYDAAAPGNHEFDYGYANLKALAEQADFPILAANVTYDGELAFGDHLVLTTASGVKIGLFGLDTPETASKAHPAKIAGVKFAGGEEMYAVAQAEVDALKAAGADYIICLGHLGIDEETAATANRSIDLLAQVTGIDVFVDGHSHSTLEQLAAATNAERKVGDTVVTSTGTKFANIGVITIKDGAVTTECVPTEDITVAEDNAIAARAAAIRAEIDAEYGAVFATSEVTLTGDKAPGNRTQETNNGDLITDAILWLATKEELSVPTENVIALTNGGGIRAAIAAGDVTKNDINTVLPFGNTVAVDYVTGKVLLEALEASTFCTPEAIGGFPQVAGIQFTVDTTKTYDQGDLYPGTTYYAPKTINRVTIDSVNGNAFDEDATYAVVTNDFVAAGGDTYYALSVSETITDTGVPLDEAVMQYITEELGGVIPAAKYAEPQGRITIKTTVSSGTSVSRPSSSRSERGETATQAEGENQVTKTNKDGSVTVTVTAADGEELVNITLPETIPAPETKFVDVPEGHWAETAINNMAGLGVVNGVGEGVYDLTSSVTRGSIATILFRFGGGAEGKTGTFADVAVGQWYTDAVGWAASVGVVTGYSATEFGPNDTITRQQLAVMLARFAKLIGMDTTADKTALSSFVDGSQVDGWAEDGVAWCVAEKVLQGKSAEILDPAAQVTRAEAAVMFDRFIALIK